ncbi:MAG: diguanylate cyclase domain-containing protein [Lachnospiraceae bacterium]
MGKRLNIGLFVDDIDAVFTKEAVKGAELGAIAIDANMYIFPGMYLDGTDISDHHVRYEYQYNTLFQFVSEKHIDVLYVMMGMIGCRVGEAQRTAFLEQFLGIPIVTLYTKMDGYASIIFDNQIAFMQGIRHLIVDHGVRKIGYVSGPKTNVDAMQRLEAYQKVLAEQGIPYREDYVIYGNFEESSEPFIGAFVEATPELEAIVFANDRMALGGYRAFSKMGIHVGRDLLVVSFDNSSFASSLTPPLTTVEANAAELSYKAIASADEFIKTKRLDNLRVDTHLVRRSSCGCLDFDYQTMSERLGIHFSKENENITAMMENIHSYLFSDYIQGDALQQIKNDLAVFVRLLTEVIKNEDWNNYEKDIKIIFSQIISQPLFRYTTAEMFSNVLMSLEHELRTFYTETAQHLKLAELFSSFYRELSITNWQVIHGHQEGMERMSRLINNMTVDMFQIEDGKQIPYERALDSLSSVGVKSAYLFTYEKPIHHPREQRFEKPKQILFRACYNDNKAVGIPEEQQYISVDDIFANDRLPASHRVTMVLSPLFSSEDLYGILMCELHHEHFHNVAPITVQISVAMKSLMLLEQQRKIHQQLEENLAKISESNDLLSEISKTDQLTGLCNRWGFLDYVQTIINNPKNHGKEILVLYADMDNLKMINDEYGHDEGDFALKEIASILREAFRNTDVIARFGGDEFVAFALLGISNYENIMKLRIAEITARHNKMVNKPYPIEMSTGICETTCNSDFDISKVLETADKKLYTEKRNKKEKKKQGTNPL